MPARAAITGVQPDAAELRKLRERVNLSQLEAADLVGCSRTTVTMIEAGLKSRFAIKLDSRSESW